jgi:hypothetical protein
MEMVGSTYPLQDPQGIAVRSIGVQPIGISRAQFCPLSPPRSVNGGLAAGLLYTSFAVISGCGHVDSSLSAVKQAHHGGELFGGQLERQFDFGMVLGEADRELSHTYTLTNTLDRPVKVLRSINGKPCCGEVEPIRPTTLLPGQSTTLTVTIYVGGATIGPVQHRAILETDHPEVPTQEFWTLATIRPRIRIEAAQQTIASLAPNSTTRLTFEAFAYGTSTDPPASLDDAQVRSSLEVDWSGPARERVIEGGLIERSRPFVVTLEADAEPGYRAGEFRLVDGGTTLLSYPLRWKVAPAVETTPAGVVVPTPPSPGPRSAPAPPRMVTARCSNSRTIGSAGASPARAFR